MSVLPRRLVSPLLLIILANALPVVEVLHGRMRVFDVVMLYWTESMMIGGFNVLRILFARGGGDEEKSKFFFAPFFLVHYFGFMLIQLVFIHSFIDDSSLEWNRAAGTDGLYWAALAGLGANHAWDFFVNYLGGGLFREASPSTQMIRPYGRVAIQQAVIIGGGFLAGSIGAGSSMVYLTLLIALKTAADLAGYAIAHGRAALRGKTGKRPVS